MAIFKNLFSSSRGQKDSARDALQDSLDHSRGPETKPAKMNLEERMAFRREVLFETIRVTLNTRSIALNTYRFRVMRTDKRGHSFVVMLDMSPTFMESTGGQHPELVATAALLTQNALTKYGLIVGGVYWRVDETLDAPVANWARPSVPVPLEQPGTTAEERRSANIDKYKQISTEQISTEEMAEFEAAWQIDSVIQIGDRTYSSDQARLDADPPTK